MKTISLYIRLFTLLFRLLFVNPNLFFQIILRPRGRYATFCRLRLQLKRDLSVLDIGCGNDSAYKLKQIFPLTFYTGVDIELFNTPHPAYIDRHILLSSESFHTFPQYLDLQSYDLIISSHNLEHCHDWVATLRSIFSSMTTGTALYLAFPTEDSVFFPSRRGTLCFYDDPTHINYPPTIHAVQSIAAEYGLREKSSCSHYQPLILRTLGFFLEPLSRVLGRTLPGTWEYWGFESLLFFTNL